MGKVSPSELRLPEMFRMQNSVGAMSVSDQRSPIIE